MTKLRLYYPAWAYDPDEDNHETEFNSLDDLRNDTEIKERMFGFLGRLKPTYAYDSVEPEYDSRNKRFYKVVFHKDNGYWGAATITGDTREEVGRCLGLLGTVAVDKEDWR